MPPTGGAKRPSSGDGNVGSGDAGSVGDDKRRRLGIPAEIFIPMPNPSRTMAVGSGTMKHSLVRRPRADSPRIASIDLISKICSFVDVGGGLYELCVAVGPTDAARIRRDYLLNNERYLAKSLRCLLFCTMGTGSGTGLPKFTWCDKVESHFDKCGNNVKDWMAVNTNWRSYCTQANLEKYKGIAWPDWLKSLLGFEEDRYAMMIFGNPAIVVELGLTDVFRHLVEEMNINLTKKLWEGFFSMSGQMDTTLASIALRRGDSNLLDCLFSAESFGLRNDTHLNEILLAAISQDNVGIESFKMILAHPKVDVNSRRAYIAHRSPLYSAVKRLVSWSNRELRLAKVHALLGVGANPRAPWTPPSQPDLIPIHVAKNAFLYKSGKTDREMWKEIVRKMKAFHQG